MHAWWALPQGVRVVAAEADLRIASAPSSGHLMFWAMQAGFAGVREYGAGHLGLQWWNRYPNNTAANWGGYDERGVVLKGTKLAIPDPLNDGNTGAFTWLPGTTYRLRIDKGDKGWRGSIHSPEAGTTVLRLLHADGDRLSHVVVWSELFCRCDASSVSAVWSNMVAIDSDGATHAIDRVNISYQSYADGGCTNTNQSCDEFGLAQASNTERLQQAPATLRFR
jgi:hypothetical protein